MIPAHRRAPIAALAASLSLAALAVPSVAAPAAPSGTVENQPLHMAKPVDGAAARSPVAGSAANTVGDLSHVVIALAIVIGIIFGLRWVARRFALVPNVGRAGRGVRLLSRTVLAPKQQVMLLQVGRRIVVVGDAGAAGMRTLCEITDPDEVAALIGEAKSAEASSSAKSFGNLFRRASEPFEEGAGEAEPPALASPPGAGGEPASSDVVGLLDKVRGLRQQFDR